MNISPERLICSWLNDRLPAPPIRALQSRPEPYWSRPTERTWFPPITRVGSLHVAVSRQKRFRAKTVGALFRCRSAGTITTISADIGVRKRLWWEDRTRWEPLKDSRILSPSKCSEICALFSHISSFVGLLPACPNKTRGLKNYG